MATDSCRYGALILVVTSFYNAPPVRLTTLGIEECVRGRKVQNGISPDKKEERALLGSLLESHGII